MSVFEKLKCALRYMLEPVSIAYWLGSAALMYLAQRVLLSDAAQSILLQAGGGLQINMQEDGQRLLIDFLEQHGHEIMLYALILMIITIVVMAKSLDCAKRINEGDFHNTDFSPVRRIGWLAVGKYLLGSLVITLVIGALIGITILVLSVLTSAISQTIATLTIALVTLFAAFFVMFVIYASTFVFLDTLSYRKMINPSLWKFKINKIGKGTLVKVVLYLFVISFILGIALSIVDGIFGESSAISIMISLAVGQFITMISLIWLGFVNQSKVDSQRDIGVVTQDDSARLLYNADTHGMSGSEKQRFVTDLQRADNALNEHNYAQVEQLLEPYTRDDNNASRYYPAYERLYHLYQQSEQQQSKYRNLQARIIHIAAQNNERFYQLVDADIFELARENNTQFAANDVYPLVKLALAHNQPQTVLVLAKDFRKRQSEHPDVVKVYTCVVKALLLQQHPDIAVQVAEQISAQYPSHPDTAALRHAADLN